MNRLKFKQCIFSDSVYLNKNELIEGIFFEDCDFNGHLILRNYSGIDLVLRKYIFHELVNLHNCSFKIFNIEQVHFTQLTVSGKINTNETVGKFKLTEVRAELIEFAHALLNADVSVVNCISETFLVKGSTVFGNITFAGDQLDVVSFEIQDATVKGAIQIENETTLNYIDWQGSVFEGPCKVESDLLLESIWLKDSVFHARTELSLPEQFTTLYIETCEFKVNLECGFKDGLEAENLKPLLELNLIGIIRGNLIYRFSHRTH